MIVFVNPDHSYFIITMFRGLLGQSYSGYLEGSV